jgi:hypothetical protein
MELCTHTMGQLKALCAQHGLRKSGVKAELVARLCDALCADEPAAKRPRTKVRVPVGASGWSYTLTVAGATSWCDGCCGEWALPVYTGRFVLGLTEPPRRQTG